MVRQSDQMLVLFKRFTKQCLRKYTSPKGAIFQNIWASLVRKYFANIFQNNPIGLEISGAHDMQQPKKSIGKFPRTLL